MQNIPSVKLGIVAVSRDCFPIELSQRRRAAVVAACEKIGVEIIEIKTTIENKIHTMQALEELKAAEANALVVFLGNFGPEGPETMLAEKFGGPVMFAAAAEEDIPVLSSERGDAFCGMLNASYNLKLRGVKAYIPEYPVGTAEEVAGMIADFVKATGCKEVLVTSGYRTFDFQKDLYDSRVASQGEEMAKLYVAQPGYSEHHAGLAVDMVIFAGGQQYYFPDYEQAAWIVEKAPEYGFILRYTEANQAITHCAPEPWHYRYVGAPHASLVTAMGISFEEYHEYLRTFTWDGVRLLIAEDGSVSETDGFDLPDSGHMVYFVPAWEGDTTPIPVPPDASYEISGNNADGFIVTVDLKP